MLPKLKLSSGRRNIEPHSSNTFIYTVVLGEVLGNYEAEKSK